MSLKFFFSLIIAGLALISCDQKITTQSVVNADGSIERTIFFKEADSVVADTNIFRINQSNGWKLEMEKGAREEGQLKHKFNIQFTKKFESVDAANKEMSPTDNDRIFKIHSALTRRFRWFYTYYDYSDTYLSLDRFAPEEQQNYFTQEDYAFIDRLPAEGKTISKADQFFLDKLNERIVDDYLAALMQREITASLLKAMANKTSDTTWRSKLYSTLPDIIKNQFKNGDGTVEDTIVDKFLETIKLPIDKAAVKNEYKTYYQEFDGQFKFVSEAATGPYTHIIKLPWQVVGSNADSVNGDALIWQPPTIKIYLKDYTMRATGREMNLWAMVVSGVIVALTLYLLFRKRATGV